MEPISTLNLGASLAHQSKSYPLKSLADKVSQLMKPLSSGQEASNTRVEKDKELMKVAQKFEAILIHQMLKAMRKTVHKSDLLNSFSLQQYESMMDEEIANEMVKHKGIGLADNLYFQLSRLEGNSNPPVQLSNQHLGVYQHE